MVAAAILKSNQAFAPIKSFLKDESLKMSF
jgi:hypothetical protein